MEQRDVFGSTRASGDLFATLAWVDSQYRNSVASGLFLLRDPKSYETRRYHVSVLTIDPTRVKQKACRLGQALVVGGSKLRLAANAKRTKHILKCVFEVSLSLRNYGY